MNILKKNHGNRNMIRLPRKLKKRYKKEFAKYMGMDIKKIKVIFPRRKFNMEIEYEHEES